MSLSALVAFAQEFGPSFEDTRSGDSAGTESGLLDSVFATRSGVPSWVGRRTPEQEIPIEWRLDGPTDREPPPLDASPAFDGSCATTASRYRSTKASRQARPQIDPALDWPVAIAVDSAPAMNNERVLRMLVGFYQSGIRAWMLPYKYMVKTTVYLEEEIAHSLRALSKRRRKPQAQLIREALREFTADEKPPLPGGLGMFDSGHSDTVARRKELLRDAARSRKWR